MMLERVTHEPRKIVEIAAAEAQMGRNAAVALLCRYFDQHGPVKTFDLLEQTRQRLVIELAARCEVKIGGHDADALLAALYKARLNGDRIGNIVDAVRAEFSGRKRLQLLEQGWIV